MSVSLVSHLFQVYIFMKLHVLRVDTEDLQPTWREREDERRGWRVGEREREREKERERE